MKFNVMMAVAVAVLSLGFAGCEQSTAETVEATNKPANETAAPETTGQTSKDSIVSDTTNPAPAVYELHVSGMMCEHCQATVTKLLEGMDGVAKAEVDHKSGQAIVTMEPGKTFDEKAAHDVIDKDYKLDSCSVAPTSN
ncbi:MAG: heavy-metal-associated domain-containing protein [Planctomycetes bacterium]|nr:heavy-metal-associated domain-containing protein [Planctomycetota bacterium]